MKKFSLFLFFLIFIYKFSFGEKNTKNPPQEKKLDARAQSKVNLDLPSIINLQEETPPQEQMPTVVIHPKAGCSLLPNRSRKSDRKNKNGKVIEVSNDQFKKKILYVYPYYEEFINKYEEISHSLREIEEKKQKKNSSSSFARKKFLRKKRKELLGEYKDKIAKELTRLEGRILLKLIYKKTGKTFYEIISELLDSWQMFTWNAAANLFDIPLSEPHEPIQYKEDCKIEKYLQELIQQGQLVF